MQILNSQRAFDESDLELLEVLSAMVAAAIEHERLSQEAHKAALVNVIGDISHDIKNMLTPIQSGVWTLEPMLHDMFEELETLCHAKGPQHELGCQVLAAMEMVRSDYVWILQAALEAADQVQARTREIADAVKGESSPPQFTLTDLNEIAREVIRPLHLVAESSGVHLQLELDEMMPPVECDRKQIYNALYNLVNNAIPETPAGGSVTLRTRAPEPNFDMVIIEVQDTGRGMPDEVKTRLFTEEAISTKPGGTGLGTRIVADVVRRHRGSITVESEADQGSLFTLYLPLRHTGAR